MRHGYVALDLAWDHDRLKGVLISSEINPISGLESQGTRPHEGLPVTVFIDLPSNPSKWLDRCVQVVMQWPTHAKHS
jgi:hypothetical protein